MRALILLLCLAASNAWSAVKWVDLTGVGSGSANGSDVNNQCAGIGDADCIGANLPAGSTMHMCNAYTGAGITIPVAGSAGNVTTYDCTCTGGTNGSITATSGTAGILANKAYTHVGNSCTVSYAGSKPVQINASNVTIGAVSIIAPGQDGITLTTPATLSNVTIDGASIVGMTRYGIIWQNSNSTTNTATDFVIQNTSFNRNANSAIFFQCNFQASDCSITRLTIDGNTVVGSGNTQIVVQDCYDGDIIGACTDPQSYTLARYTDVSITDNIVTGSTSGGGIALYGCKSSTNAQGKCVVARNTVTGNAGVIGGIDLFNSIYVTIEDNYLAESTTTSIDGNGVLVDYGNRYVIVRRNQIYDNVGLSGVDNSGVAVMVIRGQDVDVYGNIGNGNKAGLLTSGASFTESNIRFYNNSFTNNADYGWYIDASQEVSSVVLYNTILSGPGTCIYAEAAGAAQTENYNDLPCATRSNFNGVAGWSNGANSIVDDPLMAGGDNPDSAQKFRLLRGSPARRVGKDLNMGNVQDYGNRAYLHPPSMGGWEATTGDQAEARAMR